MSKATGQLLDQTPHLAGNKEGKEFKVTQHQGKLLHETYHPSCN